MDSNSSDHDDDLGQKNAVPDHDHGLGQENAVPDPDRDLGQEKLYQIPIVIWDRGICTRSQFGFGKGECCTRSRSGSGTA